MSKLCEKLIVLKDYNESLLQRVHLMKQFMENNPNKNKLFVFSEPAVARLHKPLLRDFPNFPQDDTIEKTPGYEVVSQRFPEIIESLKDHYTTLSEVLEFTEEAYNTLEEVTKSVTDLKYETNMFLMIDFFDLLVGFVQLQILLSRIVDRKLMVALYNFAYTKLHTTSEPHVQRIASLLNEYEDVWPALQKKFSHKFSILVGKTLLGIASCIEKDDIAFLQSKKPLDIMSHPDKLYYPAIDRVYFEIGLANKFRTWVHYTLAVCPDALAAKPENGSKMRGVELAARELGDSYMSPVYADELQQTCKPFQNLWRQFKSNQIKLTEKHEKKLLDTAQEKAATANRVHEAKRAYLRLQMKTTIQILIDSPGLIGPKFQLILALLTLANDEVMWFFRHYEQVPRYKKNLFKDVHDPNMGELLYYIDEMVSLINKHKSIIQNYFLEFIRSCYARIVSDLVSQTAGSFDSDSQTLKILESIVEDLNGSNNFEAMRLNWKRIQANLSFQATPFQPKIRELMEKMNLVYFFSRHVDDVEQEVFEILSLRHLYHSRKAYHMYFNQCITQANFQAIYCMSYVKLLNIWPDLAHKFIPELKAKIGTETEYFANSYINNIVCEIERNVERVIGGYLILAEQVSGESAFARIKAKMDSQNPKSKNTETMPKAGFESHYEKRGDVEGLRLQEEQVLELVRALNLSQHVRVYNTDFYPLEFLRDRLELFVRRFIFDSVNLNNSQLPCPSLLLKKLKYSLVAFKLVEQSADLDMQEIVLKAFLEEFIDQRYCESPFQMAGDKVAVENAILCFLKWYISFVSNITKQKILYSPVRRSFVSTIQTLLNFKVEEYVDIPELTALVNLVGPLGARCIDIEMAREIASRVDQLKSIIKQNEAVLRELDARALEDDLFMDAQKKFKNMNELFDLSVQIGAFMVFRTNLKEALHQSTQENAPLIRNIVKTATDLFSSTDNETFKDVIGFATDCGLSQTDFILAQALKPMSDPVWSLLPIVYTVLLCNPIWKDADYSVVYQGWSNNAHLAGVCLQHLVLVLNSNPSFSMSRFIEYASHLLLSIRKNVYVPQKAVFDKVLDKHHKNCLVWLDKVVENTDYVKRSVFENVHPYSIVRSAYVRLFEASQGKAEESDSVNE